MVQAICSVASWLVLQHKVALVLHRRLKSLYNRRDFRLIFKVRQV